MDGNMAATKIAATMDRALPLAEAMRPVLPRSVKQRVDARRASIEEDRIRKMIAEKSYDFSKLGTLGVDQRAIVDNAVRRAVQWMVMRHMSTSASVGEIARKTKGYEGDAVTKGILDVIIEGGPNGMGGVVYCFRSYGPEGAVRSVKESLAQFGISRKDPELRSRIDALIGRFQSEGKSRWASYIMEIPEPEYGH